MRNIKLNVCISLVISNGGNKNECCKYCKYCKVLFSRLKMVWFFPVFLYGFNFFCIELKVQYTRVKVLNMYWTLLNNFPEEYTWIMNCYSNFLVRNLLLFNLSWERRKKLKSNLNKYYDLFLKKYYISFWISVNKNYNNIIQSLQRKHHWLQYSNINNLK